MKRLVTPQVGMVVRQWCNREHGWMEGWWREITEVRPAELRWRNLLDGEEETIPLPQIDSIKGDFWNHELPSAVKALAPDIARKVKHEFEQCTVEYPLFCEECRYTYDKNAAQKKVQASLPLVGAVKEISINCACNTSYRIR